MLVLKGRYLSHGIRLFLTVLPACVRVIPPSLKLHDRWTICKLRVACDTHKAQPANGLLMISSVMRRYFLPCMSSCSRPERRLT